MSVMRVCGLMAAWVLLGLALFLEPALAEKRVALVIGNGAYKAAGRLANPVSDASDMASALRSVGFSVDVVLDVDRARFETAISDFSDKASGADVALVFYAGHGMGLGTETHLLPVDADFRNEFEARNRTIGLTALLGTLEGRAKTVLAFVDACRDNPLADRLAASMRGAGRAVSVTRGLARIEVGASDTLVVYATTPGRTAADGTGRNSPFTTALLAHLGTEGVEIEVLLKRVSARVQELTGNQQEPERLSRLKREFYFKPARNVPTPATSIPGMDSGMRADNVSHYSCRGKNDRFALVVGPARSQVSIQELAPSRPIVTLRIIRKATSDECAKYGFVLVGATLCMQTQGAAYLDWAARGLHLDCDSADIR